MSSTTNLYTNGTHTVQATAARYNKRLKQRGFMPVEEVKEDPVTGKGEQLGNAAKVKTETKAATKKPAAKAK